MDLFSEYRYNSNKCINKIHICPHLNKGMPALPSEKPRHCFKKYFLSHSKKHGIGVRISTSKFPNTSKQKFTQMGHPDELQ